MVNPDQHAHELSETIEKFLFEDKVEDIERFLDDLFLGFLNHSETNGIHGMAESFEGLQGLKAFLRELSKFTVSKGGVTC